MMETIFTHLVFMPGSPQPAVGQSESSNQSPSGVALSFWTTVSTMACLTAPLSNPQVQLTCLSHSDILLFSAPSALSTCSRIHSFFMLSYPDTQINHTVNGKSRYNLLQC